MGDEGSSDVSIIQATILGSRTLVSAQPHVVIGPVNKQPWPYNNIRSCIPILYQLGETSG